MSNRWAIPSIRLTIADKLGAEIIRLWVASVDFREDVMASDELMQRIADSYRKIRNTFRYILGNLDGFDPERDSVAFAEMHPLDQYFLLRAAEVDQRCARALRHLHLSSALSAAEGFLHRRSERDLLRCTEGPAVYLGSKVAGAALGADCAMAVGRCAGAAAGPSNELHLRGSLEFSADGDGESR